MTGIFAAIQLILEIISGIKSIMAFIDQNKEEKWFKSAAQTWTELKAAKTEQEKRDIAKKLGDLLSGI